MKELGIHFSINTEDGSVSMGMGATGSLDQPCKPGRHYVYVHKGADGKVFYVGKGTGSRAYSTDRGPDYVAYLQNVLKGQYSVEIVRDGISEDDATVLEDLLMQKFASTIINRQNWHAPRDSDKFEAYCNAIGAYSRERNEAGSLARRGQIDDAVSAYEKAYDFYLVARDNSDHDLGARRLLNEKFLSPAPLADSYSKVLAKAGRHAALVAFAERFQRDWGPPTTSTEVAFVKRAERSRKALTNRSTVTDSPSATSPSNPGLQNQ